MRHKYPRERLPRDTDPRIGVTLLEEDVVHGLMLLDEIIFEKQGIMLRLYDDVFHRHQVPE